MREACRDVQIEPTLLSISENEFERKVNECQCKFKHFCERTESCEKTSFDMRITNPTSQSYSDKPFGRSTNNIKRKEG